MKTSLKYFTHQGIIENSGGGYFVINGSKLDNLIKEFEEKLIEGQTFNVNPEV